MSHRPWRPLVALLTTGLLALAGLVSMPTAQAVPGQFVTASISPTSVVFGSTTVFTLTVQGGTSGDNNTASRVEVDVPVGFGTFNIVGGSFSGPAGWEQTLSGRTIQMNADRSSNDLEPTQTLTIRVSGQATAAGNQTWTTRAYKGTANTSQALTVEASPVVAVSGGSQTITFAALGDKTYGDPAFTVSATGGASGNPVTFTASGNCTSGGTNGATITITGAGSCTVTANQAAGGGYTAATPVARSFSIAQAGQTISFPGTPSQTYGGPSVTLAATASSGLPVSYAVLSGPCSVSGSTLSYSGAGTCDVRASQGGNANYLAAPSVTNTVTIAKATATMTLSGLSHTYDGSGKAATVTTDPAGLSGVSVTYTRDGSPVGSPTNAGSYAVTATLDNPNYAAESADGTLVIAPKSISGSFIVADKVYDGTTAATVLGRFLDGVVAGDNVQLAGGTATFGSKNVGTRTATLSGAGLTGTHAANYTLSGVSTAQGEITPLQVSGTFAASDKTYDGNTAATGTAGLVGTIGGDDVAASYTADFAGEDAGTWSVTATLTLTGTDAGNYTLASATVVDDAATIHAKQLTGAFTASNKVYDGTTVATVASTSLPGVVSGDTVSLDVTGAAFGTKNVGNGKTVTANLALSGLDAGNYSLPGSTATTTADITEKALTGSFTAADKVWDGTTAATISGRQLNGAIAGDDVTLVGGSATFDTAAVGSGKTVTGSGFSLSGVDAGNYTLTPAQPWTTTASITPLYRGSGFYAPVDMTPAGSTTKVWNTIKGGQTVPLKFEFFNAETEAEQTDTTLLKFTVQPISCTSTASTGDPIEVVTTGGTVLRYDATGGQFIQNWKTPTTVNTCYAVWVSTPDVTTVGPAYFKILK